jgi:ABC-type lipoprotein export system ATPase subunit
MRGKGKKDAAVPLQTQPQRDEYMFKDLSLKIKAGTSNAIVGHSGFGKTTLLNMIVSLQ